MEAQVESAVVGVAGEYDVIMMPVEEREAHSFGLRHTFLPKTAPSGRRDLLLRTMIGGE